MTPAIILIHPQLAENIGAAARACANFGLSDLRLIAPRDGWPNARAFEVASTGKEVLEAVTLYTTTAEALHDIHIAYATTARPRDMAKPVLVPETAIADMRTEQTNGHRCAILLGPERTGLTNEDITLCHRIITIPTAVDAPSLNLAQSLVVLAYEWFKGRGSGVRDQGSGKATSTSPRAQFAEIEGFFGQLEQELDRVNFWNVAHKKPLMWQHLRAMFLRAELTEQEVRTLRGLVRSLTEAKPHT